MKKEKEEQESEQEQEDQEIDYSLLKDFDFAKNFLLDWGFRFKGIRKQKSVDFKALEEYFKKTKTVAILEQPTEFLYEHIERISGNLDLSGSKCKELNQIKEIGGWLDIEDSLVRSMSSLTKVGSYLNMSGTKIKKFEELTEIGGFLDCRDTLDIDFPKLQKVSGGIDLVGSKIKDFPELREVGGTIYMNCGKREEWVKIFRNRSRGDLAKKIVEVF
jgi:hypothetical protein